MFGSSLQTRREVGNTSMLADLVKAGNVRAISHLITLLECHHPDSDRILRLLVPGFHPAAVIGITGYPGAGKSTVVAQLVSAYRRLGLRVGVLAVDISSPVSGGALLGDRIRMQEHTLDPGVYIRSMATRGHHGGLAQTTSSAAFVLEAAGYEIILIETIGVGQNEMEVADLAHTVVAIVAPGLGDEVQAMKAGLLEVAHIVVVNKGDMTGADAAMRDLREWCPTVLCTVATRGEGIPELVAAIAEHQRLRDLQGSSVRLVREETSL